MNKNAKLFDGDFVINWANKGIDGVVSLEDSEEWKDGYRMALKTLVMLLERDRFPSEQGASERLREQRDNAMGEWNESMNVSKSLAESCAFYQGEAAKLRSALEHIQWGAWAVTHDSEGLEIWTTKRINPIKIIEEALG